MPVWRRQGNEQSKHTEDGLQTTSQKNTVLIPNSREFILYLFLTEPHPCIQGKNKKPNSKSPATCHPSPKTIYY